MKQEPPRVITIRLSADLHQSLKDEAAENETSMNRLCVAKLKQLLTPSTQTPQPAAGYGSVSNL